MINQLKTEFDKRRIEYSEEFTVGNYDDNGIAILNKIPTLTTEFCEIGFYNKIIYFVLIAKSDSLKNDFYLSIKEFKNLQIYGFKDFKINYELNENLEVNIKKEKYFQVQFSFNTDVTTVSNLIQNYDKILVKIRDNDISIINQINGIDV